MTALDMVLRRLRMLADRALLLRVSYRGAVRLLQVSSRGVSRKWFRLGHSALRF